MRVRKPEFLVPRVRARGRAQGGESYTCRAALQGGFYAFETEYEETDVCIVLCEAVRTAVTLEIQILRRFNLARARLSRPRGEARSWSRILGLSYTPIATNVTTQRAQSDSYLFVTSGST